MHHAISTRAASLTGAALVLGGLFWAASLARFEFTAIQWPEPPTVVSVEDPPEPPPTPPRTETPPTSAPDAVVSPMPLPFQPYEALEGPSEAAFTFDPGPAIDPGPPQVTAPHWLNQPSNLGGYYPRRPITRGMAGEVRLDCVVGTDGWLRACAVLAETPQGWGFGEAARRIAEDHRMRPATRDGAPIEARYRMTVPFRVE